MELGPRDGKVAPKRQAPKVTRVWPADEPWYDRYHLDSWILFAMIIFLLGIMLIPLGYYLFEFFVAWFTWAWLDSLYKQSEH